MEGEGPARSQALVGAHIRCGGEPERQLGARWSTGSSTGPRKPRGGDRCAHISAPPPGSAARRHELGCFHLFFLFLQPKGILEMMWIQKK